MTDSNGARPSNEELQKLIAVMDDLIGYSSGNDSFVYFNSDAVRRQIAALARAELQRRESASVPENLIWEWEREYNVGDAGSFAEYIANKAAAWVRGE